MCFAGILPTFVNCCCPDNVYLQHKRGDMEQGWDPEVRLFFGSILRTVSWGLIWMIANATLGLYHGLAFGLPRWPSVIFYVVDIALLVLLVRYIARQWNRQRFNEEIPARPDR